MNWKTLLTALLPIIAACSTSEFDQLQGTGVFEEQAPRPEVGAVINGSFLPGQLGIGTEQVASRGSSLVFFELVDSDFAPLNDITLAEKGLEFQSASLSSTCSRQGAAVLSPTAGSGGGVGVLEFDGFGSGYFEALWKDEGCDGQDRITGTVILGVRSEPGRTLRWTVSGIVNVLPPELGRLEFIAAEPKAVGLRGSGLPDTSKITFLLMDANGNPVPDASVDFSLSSTGTGANLRSDEVTTDSNGIARVTLSAGTTPSSVSITASSVDGFSGTTLRSQTAPVAVSRLVPDQDSISMRATAMTVRDIDGVEVDLVVRLADRFNVPPAKGTLVRFVTEAGALLDRPEDDDGDAADDSSPPLQGACQTDDTGRCGVRLVLQGERPNDRRISVLAYSEGEESFTDGNGSQAYEQGEVFRDLPEAFLDANENGSFDPASEEFIPPPDGGIGLNDAFDGVICSGDSCEVARRIHVRDQLSIGLSEGVGSPEFSFDDELPANERLDLVGQQDQVDIRVRVQDERGQPLPDGTRLTMRADVGEVRSPVERLIPDDLADASGSSTYAFSVSAPNATQCQSGRLQLELVLPAVVDRTGLEVAPEARRVFERDVRYFPTPEVRMSAPVSEVVGEGSVPLFIDLQCPGYRDIPLQLSIVDPVDNATLEDPNVVIPAGQTSVTTTARIGASNQPRVVTIFARSGAEPEFFIETDSAQVSITATPE